LCEREREGERERDYKEKEYKGEIPRIEGEGENMYRKSVAYNMRDANES
jgi:hypothetical protein